MKAQKIVPPEMLNSFNHTSPPQSYRNSNEPNEYVTLALAAEVEREGLLELVTVLNRRLDKERSDADILSVSDYYSVQNWVDLFFFALASEHFTDREEQVREIGIQTSEIRDGESGNREDRYWLQGENLAQIFERQRRIHRYGTGAA